MAIPNLLCPWSINYLKATRELAAGKIELMGFRPSSTGVGPIPNISGSTGKDGRRKLATSKLSRCGILSITPKNKKTVKPLQKDFDPKTITWQELESIFPFLNAMEGCSQEDEHHEEGNVQIHTQMVVTAAMELADMYQLSPRQTQTLFLGALLHDLAKPMTLQQDEEGKVSSPKHARKGKEFLQHFWWENPPDISPKMQKEVLGLIALHAWPVRFLEREHPGDSPIKASFQTSNFLLGLLAQADMQGRICQDKDAQKQAIQTAQLYSTYAKELGCLTSPRDFYNNHTRYQYSQKRGDIPHYSQISEHTQFTCTILCGLPTSGKDTWLTKNYSKENTIISRDEIRKTFRKYNRKNEGKTLQEMKAQFKVALALKKNCALNATNLRAELRRNWIELATSYGARVEIIHLLISKTEALHRNTQHESTSNLPFSRLSTQ